MNTLYYIPPENNILACIHCKKYVEFLDTSECIFDNIRLYFLSICLLRRGNRLCLVLSASQFVILALNLIWEFTMLLRNGTVTGLR